MEVQEIIDRSPRFRAIFQVLCLRCACCAMYVVSKEEHDVKIECEGYILCWSL